MEKDKDIRDSKLANIFIDVNMINHDRETSNSLGESFTLDNGIPIDRKTVYSNSNLHIVGANKSSVSQINYIDASHYPLLKNEAMAFFNNGYFILCNGVNQALIDDARKYVDSNYINFLKMSKRCDDWRLHFEQDISYDINANGPLIDHIPIVNLLVKSPIVIGKLVGLIGREISSIFYSQIAYRTPVPKKNRFEYYTPGAEYHLDGQANSNGDRFPDHWTVQIGIALVDIKSKSMGNFTVFPGKHSSICWNNYCELKKSKMLPHFDNEERICLNAGDVIFCHVLLPHRGGKNIIDPTLYEQDPFVKNIPKMTREMIFIRIRGKGIDYQSVERSLAVLENPWYEFEKMIQDFII
jgi:hypothetical protein